MKKSLRLTLILIMTFALGVDGKESNSNLEKKSTESIYAHQLTTVIGDVKQAQIFNKLLDKKQVDMVLQGFDKMKLSGVRIAIFPEVGNPNPEMFDYLYQKAVAMNFKIYANPAHFGGAKRIANGSLDDVTEELKGKPEKTQRLIKRLKDFARKYPCAWMSPFNEDGPVDKVWGLNQTNEIYKSCKGELNGALLLGPDCFALPKAISYLKKTNILEHIDVAASHNLGFHHKSWAAFIEIAKKNHLDVWDSETNHRKKFPNKATRIRAAIDAGVNGLVLYNSWNGIDLKDGSLLPSSKELMDIYLKMEI
jgi:hypothetical protein